MGFSILFWLSWKFWLKCDQFICIICCPCGAVVQAVVLAVWDQTELEEVEVLECLMLAVLHLPYFAYLRFTLCIILYAILSNLCACDISLGSHFILIFHFLLIYLLFSPYTYCLYLILYLYSIYKSSSCLIR